jgi:hypothetical protein
VGVLGWSLRLRGLPGAPGGVPVKNDTNFSGGYAYAVAAQCPHAPPLAKKQARPPPPLSNPRPGPVQSVSNTVPSPVIARVLGPCVPAKTTGTRAMGPIPRFGSVD